MARESGVHGRQGEEKEREIWGGWSDGQLRGWTLESTPRGSRRLDGGGDEKGARRIYARQ